MLNYINHRDPAIRSLIEFPYYFTRGSGYQLGGEEHVSLSMLATWADAVDMNCFYCGGFMYFETEADKAMFIIKWI